MEKTTLIVTDCIKFGWNAFKQRPWFFVGTVLIYAIIQFAVGMIQETMPGILSFVISIIVSTFLYTGLVGVYLKAHDNVSAPTLKDLWNPKPFLNYLILSVLLMVIILIGLVLLIIPGIIAALMFSFSGFLVVDKGMNPIAALKESYRLVKGHLGKLALLGLAIFGLAVLGIIPLLLGLLVVAPVAMFATIHAYRTLSGGTLAKKEDVVPTPEPTIVA